jgi:hypothetical protein
MKNIIISLKIIIVFILIFTTSCSKYEEGPIISFRSKEKRLINTWEIKEILRNGENCEFSGNSVYVFNEDGTGAHDYLAMDCYIEWEFDKKKENLLIKENSNGEYQNYKIIRLTMTELWLQLTWEDDVTTMKYIPKLYE